VVKALTGVEKVISAGGVTVPYDVVALAGAATLEELSRRVIGRIRTVQGVIRTLPCSVVSLQSGRKRTSPGRKSESTVRDQPRALAMLGTGPIRTISREELKSKVDRGEPIILVMALNRWAFDAKHIPGSVHFDDPDELFANLGKDDEIAVYCSNVDCLSSVALYRALVERGYGNVRRYAGGLIDWEEAGLPLEGNLAGSPGEERRQDPEQG
jgi:rhodanese-related sulfurtransferase